MIHRFSWLPQLVPQDLFETHEAYIERLYQLFHTDWIQTTQTFNGMPIHVKRHPPYDGIFLNKHATFRHLITEGPDEARRQISQDRCKRIHWPLALLDNNHRNDVLYWQDRRPNGTGHILALSDFSYKLVLTERGARSEKFLLLWTAFPVQGTNQKAKNQREYALFQSQKS